MDPIPGPPGPPAEPRQRWRLTFRRRPDAPSATHREVAGAWLAGLDRAGLPLPRGDGARPRPPLTFAAPLPVGVAVERDLADLVLADRLPVWAVRDAVAASVPAGIELVDLHDVWLGGSPLAAVVAAADYRLTVEGPADPGIDRWRQAAGDLLGAQTIPRQRPKGEGLVAYDLRPLLAAIAIPDGPGPRIVWIRTRFDPQRGAGRPEEVLAALADRVGCSLVAGATVRERLILADGLDGAGWPPPAV